MCISLLELQGHKLIRIPGLRGPDPFTGQSDPGNNVKMEFLGFCVILRLCVSLSQNLGHFDTGSGS